jgi:hypothetical protein
MKSLARKDPSGADNLVKQVIVKANGVFLWVTVVVISLLRGLTHNDSIQFLEKRLNEIPETLEGVYDRILASVEPIYRERGSRIFQFKFATERIGSPMPTNLAFHYALAFDLQEALSKPLAKETLSPAVHRDFSERDLVLKNHEKIEPIIATSCGGLLEAKLVRHTYHDSDVQEESRGIQIEVQWIHRTAHDYVETPQVWEKILSQTEKFPGDPFDPHLALTMSYVSVLKDPFLGFGDELWLLESLNKSWYAVSDHVNFMYPNSTRIQIQVLEEFDRVATNTLYLMRNQGSFKTSQVHWSNWQLPAIWKTSFLYRVIEDGLCWYLQLKVQEDSWIKTISGTGSPLLAYCFLLHYGIGSINDWCEIIDILIKNGWHPGEMYEGFTVWEYWIYLLAKAPQWDFELSNMDNIERATMTMLWSGVDLNVQPIRNSEIWNRIFPASEMTRYSSVECHIIRDQTVRIGLDR